MTTFTRSILVSIFTTALDFATSILFVEAFGLNHELAVFIGTVIGFLANFSLNRWWAFEAHEGHLGWQFVRVLPVQAGSSALRPAIVWVFEKLAIKYWIANLVAAAIVYLVWNYPMNRWFVFRRTPAHDSPQT
ncbi:MAG: GtrA family protein [Kofleriaceae bacterium]